MRNAPLLATASCLFQTHFCAHGCVRVPACVRPCVHPWGLGTPAGACQKKTERWPGRAMADVRLQYAPTPCARKHTRPRPQEEKLLHDCFAKFRLKPGTAAQTCASDTKGMEEASHSLPSLPRTVIGNGNIRPWHAEGPEFYPRGTQVRVPQGQVFQ